MNYSERKDEDMFDALFPQEQYRLEEEYFKYRLNDAVSDNHKYRQGSLLLLAGSKGMSGSLLLAALAAAKSGIGLLHIATRKEVYRDVFPELPGALYHIPEEETCPAMQKEIEPLRRKVNALVAGPGLGLGREEEKLLHYLLDWDRALLLDADALTLLAKSPSLQEAFQKRQERSSTTVLTPHEGEAKRLAIYHTSEENWQRMTRIEKVTSLAKFYQCHIILKGKGSLCASPGAQRIYKNTSGGIGLAKGGSGDILAGLAGGLLAQNFDGFEATVFATYWHGLAGDLASKEKHWRCHLPQDTLDYLGKVLL